MSTYAVDTTLVERPTVFGNTTQYNVAEVIMANIPTLIAGGAGQAVTVTVDASEENLPADFNYTVVATPSVACSVNYDNKAADSFDVILTPLTSGVTLAAGTVDCVVTWPNGAEVQ